jgi:anaerobic magnesium-protoporphyrin IX monomethyl ester cyclase
MYKVLLINPNSPSFVTSNDDAIPIGLLYLASILKQCGKQVILNDMAIGDHIDYAFNPDMVGITCTFSGNMPEVIRLSQIIKKQLDCKIIIGGIHPTLFAKQILEKYETIDYVCLGEGENVIKNVVQDMPLKQIDNFAYRDQQKNIIVNDTRKFIQNPDDIPFPDYTVIKLDKYKIDITKRKNQNLPTCTSIPILSSRSCPNRCNFCSMFLVHGPKWRPRTAKNVVDEIEFMYYYYNKRRFSFIDDNMTLNKKRTMAIAQEIIDRDLKISFDTPIGIAINTLDEQVIDILVQAGLEGACIAPESGSDYIRNQIIRKHTSTEKIYQTIKCFKKHKSVFLRAFFIVGFPEETHQTLQNTYDMIKNLANDIDSISIFYLVPFPGTKLFEQCKSENLLQMDTNDDTIVSMSSNYINDNSETVFIKPHSLTIEELSSWRKKMYEHINNTFLQRKNNAKTIGNL